MSPGRVVGSAGGLQTSAAAESVPSPPVLSRFRHESPQFLVIKPEQVDIEIGFLPLRKLHPQKGVVGRVNASMTLRCDEGMSRQAR